MLYLRIPTGWHFSTIEEQDCLQNDDDLEKIIPLQEIIKEELRHHQRGQHAIPICSAITHHETLIIYFRKSATLLEASLLEYMPQRNAKFKSEHTDFICYGPKEKIAKDYVGRLWFHREELTTQLSAEKKQDLIDTAKQQKADRQHYGDSPKPT